jgi:hypothetical protein
MRKRDLLRAGAAGLALFVAGCGSAPAVGGDSANAPEWSRSGNAFVAEGEQLWQRKTDLLSVISKVSAVQIKRSSPCPIITMRGQKTFLGSSDAFVYVDGAQAGNTCVLEMMRSEDVDRIEVYPMGVSNRPEYAPNPNGLILIFMRTARSDSGAGR